MQDNTEGGPHQLVEGYGLFARGLSALFHGIRDAGVFFGVGTSPDKDPNRRGGWLATWIALGGKKEDYPAGVINFILDVVNDYDLTIIGIQYIKPDGNEGYSDGSIPKKGDLLYLVRSTIVNGVRVNIWSVDPPKKKPKPKPKPKPKDKKDLGEDARETE